jgi:hypothetical protein
VLLSPLSDRDYLAGKAVGNGLIAAVPAAVCLGACFAFLPGARSIVSWLSVPVALLSIYCLTTPVAAALSAMFPRVVDLNSIGRGSNAHGLAGLLGMLTFVVAGALNAAVALTAAYWSGRALVTLAVLIVWCAISMLAARLLFQSASRIFATRRENLALL